LLVFQFSNKRSFVQSCITFLPLPDLINENADRYVAEQNNHEKRNIQAAIIQAVEQAGGKFLKPCKTNSSLWQRVPFEETRQKVAHALQYRVRVCREDSSAGGAVVLITPSPSNEKLSRKRVAAAAMERNGRSTRKKNTSGRTAATRRPSDSPRRVSMEQPPAMVSSSDLRQPSPREQQQHQGIEEYHGGCFGGPQGYGQYNLQQQQRRPDGDFAQAHLPGNGDCFDDSAYHPYRYHLSDRADHDRHDHNGSDFLPLTATSAHETLPFDAFNAGLTVIPIFDGSSDSDDSLEFYHWPSSARHHNQYDE
jgi:hypothetical protein